MSARAFPLAVVLSAITDRDLTEKRPLVNFACFMLDRYDLTSADLRTAFDVLCADILNQQPALAAVRMSAATAAVIDDAGQFNRPAVIAKWVADQSKLFGKTITLERAAFVRRCSPVSFGA